MSMYSFVKEKSKNAYNLMNTYPEFVLNSGNRMAEHKTLKDFEEKYVQNLSPQNYEWFQMQFYQHVDKPGKLTHLRRMKLTMANGLPRFDLSLG
ncbi:hypothetical protein GO009_16840 [Muricauda sp. TY007]|uniref:hypothetical protein n=1 Tax=Allomuricauda sp. TY007 TaxID=2683200 RepID=UPI0013C0612D|nr:hypothetical protein [Muricauda sp. TY007]NDV17687.1 hypothetical protein [Muricauda sp. TY007]